MGSLYSGRGFIDRVGDESIIVAAGLRECATCLGRGLLAAVAPDAVAADPVHARDAPGGAGDT